MHTERKVAVVILAAGKGTRMRSLFLPKPLISFGGRPLITWILDAVVQADLGVDPHIMVGHMGEQIVDELGPYFDYIYQKEQLGTGHAVREALQQLPSCDDILVLNGDHPLVTGRTIASLFRVHQATGYPMTLATVTVTDFLGWRSTFRDFGRVLRDGDGQIEGIVEARHATHEQRAIAEVNPGYYCFSRTWLESVIPYLTPNPANGEYYLTDLVALAAYDNKAVGSYRIDDPREGLGINSPEQLREIERVFEIHSFEPRF